MKTPLTLLILLFTIFVNAQTEKGTWALGIGINLNDEVIVLPINIQSSGFGGFNISKGKSTYLSTVSNYKFHPSVGYFITNNLMVGLQTGMAYSFSSGFEQIYNRFSIGPEIRQYFLTGSIKPFVGLSANFSRINYKYFVISGQKENNKINQTMAGLYTGVAVFPYKNFSLDAQFGYFYFNRKIEICKCRSSYNGLIFSLGFNFFFQ